MHVHQMDVKTAFLNEQLEEETYMKPPKGYFQENSELVWRLKKSIYGLKQSPRCWNHSIDEQLKMMEFQPTPSDPCIYKSKENVIIGLYVDDILIAGQDLNRINEIKKELSRHYELKDLGQMKSFLGVEIDQRPNGDIFLSQLKYTQKIIDDFSMSKCNPIDTPASPDSRLIPMKEGEKVDIHQHQSAIGSLIYLSTKTHPDISFAVHQVSHHCHNPSKTHWTAVKRIIRYLKGSYFELWNFIQTLVNR